MFSLKLEIVGFQMVIILRILTTLNGCYRKTKLVALIHGHCAFVLRLLSVFV